MEIIKKIIMIFKSTTYGFTPLESHGSQDGDRYKSKSLFRKGGWDKKLPFLTGFIGTAALLAVYFFAVSLISGWPFALDQFGRFWYFIVSLAIGFGIQIGLYAYLKNAVHQKNASAGVLAVSGATSTAAMLSCCVHYLANILPIIGATGIIGLIGQYQVEFFWVGLAFNIGGIVYISRKVIIFHRL